MYELTCPSCQTSRHFAFIRIGARSVCPQCQHPFIIKTDHYSRQLTTASVAGGSGGRDPLTSVPASTPPPPTAADKVRGLPARAMAHLVNQTAGQTAKQPAHPQQSQPATAGQAAQVSQPTQAGATSQNGQPQSVPSTAVPIATAAGSRAVPPVSRLIAAKVRQQRRKQMVTWMTLVFVVLLFVVIATMLVGLNRDEPTPERAETAAIVPPVTLTLFKVGPSQWEELDEVPYEVNHNEPLGLEGYGLVPNGEDGDFMIVGTVVCSSFDLFDTARLQLMLVDGTSRLFARTDISLPPMSGQRENARYPIRIAMPKEMHRRLSTVEWEIVPGSPMNDGVMLSPKRVTATGSDKDTRVRVVYHNSFDKPIYKLSISIRAVDPRGKSLVHWIGQWKKTLEPDQTVELLIPTPLDSSLPAVGDWQVHTAAEMAEAPLIDAVEDEDFLP